MKKKCKGSEEGLDLGNASLRDLFIVFLWIIQEHCHPEVQKEINRLWKERQMRVWKEQDKVLQKLIRSLSYGEVGRVNSRNL